MDRQVLGEEASVSIELVPMLKDNYGYFITCKQTNKKAFVDIAKGCEKIAFEKFGWDDKEQEIYVLTTHKHWDHSGGNLDFLNLFKNKNVKITIYGGILDNIPGCTNPLSDNEEFYIGNIQVTALFTPCHTKGHIIYYLHPSLNFPGALLTGDTVFVGGIGAFFEGNANDMVNIMEKLIKFPEETLIFPGHEYALNFLPNAYKLDKENQKLRSILEWAQESKKKSMPAAPSSIGQEKICNMYMRAVMKDGLKGYFENVNHSDKIKLIETVYEII